MTRECGRIRSLLAGFHDGELDLAAQVQVQTHVTTCAWCAEEQRLLLMLRDTLRATVATGGIEEEDATLRRQVLGRLQAERSRSWARRVERMFEDRHLWAAAGAMLATLACVAAAVGVMRLTRLEQPASMAALIGAMSDPGSNQNPVSVDGRMLLPRANADVPNVIGGSRLDRDDAVLTLAAVVTREGQVRNLELLQEDWQSPGADRATLDMLEAASQARFEPARAGGAPIAVNVVWLVAHTTVRGRTIDLFEGTTPVPAWRVRSLRPSRGPVSQHLALRESHA
jgi:Putative zinc-finger